MITDTISPYESLSHYDLPLIHRFSHQQWTAIGPSEYIGDFVSTVCPMMSRPAPPVPFHVRSLPHHTSLEVSNWLY